MKKIFAVICALTMVAFMSTFSIADPGGEPNNTHCQGVGNANSPCGGDGDIVIGGGSFAVGVGAIGGAIDTDHAPDGFLEGFALWIGGGNGGAGGISGAGGLAGGQAAGAILSGNTGADVAVVGGGITNTKSGLLLFPNGLLSIGVYSESNTEAHTGGIASIYSEGFLGGAEATIGGAAAQGSLDASYMTEPTWGFDSNGFTGGIAGQGSAGYFTGFALTGVLIGDASADVFAQIDMAGATRSESYRWIEFNDGYKTEGLRTNVGAATVVSTDVDTNTDGTNLFGFIPITLRVANVDGGWIASGGAKTLTIQAAGNGSGGAIAGAIGHYSGSGNLGDNYSGSANGYSQTTVTTLHGANGSINSAAAGMHVTTLPYIPQP